MGGINGSCDWVNDQFIIFLLNAVRSKAFKQSDPNVNQHDRANIHDENIGRFHPSCYACAFTTAVNGKGEIPHLPKSQSNL